VFKGTYQHRIDPKGRLPIPAAFRRTLGDAPAVVATLVDQCLAVYPMAEWARLEAQLAALPAFSKPVKALTRLLASRAVDCEIDLQGRILLPLALRQAAGLERDAAGGKLVQCGGDAMMGSGSGIPLGGATGLEQFVSYDPDDYESTVAGIKHMEDAVKDAAKTAGAPIKVTGFLRYALGEGIEKKEEDFAAEVAKTAAAASKGA